MRSEDFHYIPNPDASKAHCAAIPDPGRMDRTCVSFVRTGILILWNLSMREILLSAISTIEFIHLVVVY